MLKVTNTNPEKIEKGKDKGKSKPIRRAGFTFPGGESTYKDSQFSAGEIVQINHHPHLELVQVPDKPEQTGEK